MNRKEAIGELRRKAKRFGIRALTEKDPEVRAMLEQKKDRAEQLAGRIEKLGRPERADVEAMR